MRMFLRPVCCFVALSTASAFAAPSDQTVVQVQLEKGHRPLLHITGDTYSMLVNCKDAVIEKFTAGDQELIGDVPLCPTLNTGKVNGPGKAEIVQNGPALCEVHLTKLWWTDLKADIEMVFYCYRDRVFAGVNVTPAGDAPDLMIGWYGGAKFSMPLVMSSERELQKLASFNGQDPNSALVVAEPWVQFGEPGKERKTAVQYRNSVGKFLSGYGYRSAFAGTRQASVILMACRSNEELQEAIRAETALSFASVSVSGGQFGRYEGAKGYFTIECSKSDGDDLNISAALNAPPPPKVSTPTAMEHLSIALSKITWPLGLVLFALLAVAVFGFMARPTPGSRSARLRPKALALVATIALIANAFWLLRLPPAPAPSTPPMPRHPVPAVFRVGDPPENAVLTNADGSSLPQHIQSRTRADGTTETVFAVDLAPEGESTFALRATASSAGSVTDQQRVN